MDHTGMFLKPRGLAPRRIRRPNEPPVKDLRYFNECLESIEALAQLPEVERDFHIFQINNYLETTIEREMRRLHRSVPGYSSVHYMQSLRSFNGALRVRGETSAVDILQSEQCRTNFMNCHSELDNTQTKNEDENFPCYVLKNWTVIKHSYSLLLTLRGVLVEMRTRKVLNKSFTTNEVTQCLSNTNIRTVDCDYILKGLFVDPKNVIPKEIKVHFQNNKFPKDWVEVCKKWHSIMLKLCKSKQLRVDMGERISVEGRGRKPDTRYQAEESQSEESCSSHDDSSDFEIAQGNGSYSSESSDVQSQRMTLRKRVLPPKKYSSHLPTYNREKNCSSKIKSKGKINKVSRTVVLDSKRDSQKDVLLQREIRRTNRRKLKVGVPDRLPVEKKEYPLRTPVLRSSKVGNSTKVVLTPKNGKVQKKYVPTPWKLALRRTSDINSSAASAQSTPKSSKRLLQPKKYRRAYFQKDD